MEFKPVVFSKSTTLRIEVGLFTHAAEVTDITDISKEK